MATASTSAVSSSVWHGYLLDNICLPLPQCVTDSSDLARPAYTNIKSAEYCDSAEVLDIKAELLIRMWKAAKRPLVYAGAGISTSSGIRDYASNAKNSAVQPKKMPLTMSNIMALKPTPAHQVITALEKAGMVWGWLQQNHDGLAQKAGFPAHKVNELHGAWLDSAKNPIIKMTGTLRSDLCEWMSQMEEMCDFVFAVGTSFSGLNADRCAATCAKRHMRNKVGQGIAIISIQQTPMDDRAALRIFSKIDDFMLIVAKKMVLQLDTEVHRYTPAPLPVGPLAEDVWEAERTERRAAYDAHLEALAKSAERKALAPPKVTAEVKETKRRASVSPARKRTSSTTRPSAGKA